MPRPIEKLGLEISQLLTRILPKKDREISGLNSSVLKPDDKLVQEELPLNGRHRITLPDGRIVDAEFWHGRTLWTSDVTSRRK